MRTYVVLFCKGHVISYGYAESGKCHDSRPIEIVPFDAPAINCLLRDYVSGEEEKSCEGQNRRDVVCKAALPEVAA